MRRKKAAKSRTRVRSFRLTEAERKDLVAIRDTFRLYGCTEALSLAALFTNMVIGAQPGSNVLARKLLDTLAAQVQFCSIANKQRFRDRKVQ